LQNYFEIYHKNRNGSQWLV